MEPLGANPNRIVRTTRSSPPHRRVGRSGGDPGAPITRECSWSAASSPTQDQVRSLLVGLPDPERPGRLRFAGQVDHGLVPAARRRVRELLGPLVTTGSPFVEPEAALLGGRWARPGPGDPAPVFVRPEVAVEVSFLGWESGRLRHPAYAGPTRLL